MTKKVMQVSEVAKEFHRKLRTDYPVDLDYITTCIKNWQLQYKPVGFVETIIHDNLEKLKKNGIKIGD